VAKEVNKRAVPRTHVHGGRTAAERDSVVVLAGKDKGKRGKVLKSIASKNAVIVEGVNLMKKATRPSQKNPQGGIIQREAPIDASNVMLVCPQCGEPARVTRERTPDGGIVRRCKKCNQPVDK
jgi:large subunit ribosomal protein L24